MSIVRTLLNNVRSSLVDWLYPHDSHGSHTGGVGGFLSHLLGNYANARKIPINEKTALSNPAVWAAVRVIAENIATLPIHVYKRENDILEKDYNHKLYSLLHDSPDGITPSINFFESLISNTLIYGNAFVEIVRDRYGDVEALYLLSSNKMTLKSINGVLIYEYNDNGTIIKFGVNEILHIAGLGTNGIVGLSPISLFADEMRTMISQREFALDFFAGGARNTPVITHPNVLQATTRENLKKSFRKSWNEGVVVLEEGVKVDPMTMALSDAQFLESRRFSVEEIARIFNVPPHMIADLSNSTFSNIYEQNKSLARHTLNPWCTRIERAINLKLFNVKEKGKYFIKFNLDALLRSDPMSRQQSYQIQLNNGIISRNEWRRNEDLPPLNDAYADEYFVSQQIRPLKDGFGIINESKE